MSIDNLYDFFKKINYRRILPVLLCPVLLLCTSISVYAYTGLDGYYNSFPLVTVDNNQALRLVVYSPSGNFSQTVAPFSTNEYLFSNSSFSDVTQIRIGTSNVHFDVLFNYNNFDYYFYCTFSCNSELNFDFIPSRVLVRTYDNQYGSASGSIAYDLEDLQIYYTNDTTKRGFSICGKLPDSINNTCIDVLDVLGSGSIDSNLYVSGAVFAFEKNSSSSTSSIVNAINNQTTQQNNNFNNFMGSGSQFGGTTSGIQSGNDELSGYIDEYTQIEQTMHNNFESAQSALIGDFTGFTWGSLANTLNWTSDYMQQIYLNSGDFKMMIILPLLLGIALFFIGRGAIILSNSNKDN